MKELNDRQRRFCELVSEGVPAGRAYEQAGYSQRGDSAVQQASKLQKEPQIAAYLATLRAKAVEAADISREQLVTYLSSAILTPLDQIDASHPLCQEHHYHPGGEGRPDTVKVKAVDKLRAAQILVGLTGWNKPLKIEGNLTLDRVLSEISATGLPSDDD